MYQLALDFCIAALVLAVSAGVGSRVLQATRLKIEGGLENLLFSLAAGAVLFSFVILLLGVGPGLSKGLLLALLFAGAVICFDCLRGLARSFAKLARAVWWHARTLAKTPFSLESICFFGVVALLSLHFLSSLALPATYSLGPIDWDSLGYHLTVPKLYLEYGRIVFLDFQPNSNWPFAMQMLYIPALAFGSAVAAKLVAFGLSLALVAAVFLLGKKVLGSTQGGVASAAILLSSQAVSVAFGSATVDLALALFSCAALLCLLQWRQTPCLGWMLLAGFFTGAVGATKLNGAVMLPAFFAVAAWLVWERLHCVTAKAGKSTASGFGKRSWVQAALLLVGFIVVAGLVVAPWLAKTYMFVGNPVWPFYYPVFEKLGFADNGASAWASAFSLGSIGGMGVAKTLQNFVLSPFYITFQGRLFNSLLSPLFLALIPLVLLFRRPRGLGLLAGFAAVCYASWFFSFQETRYLFVALPALCVVAAFSLCELGRACAGNFSKNKFLAALPAIAIAMVLLASFAVAFAYKANALPSALGLESRESYLLRSQYNYAAAQWANENIPKGSKILLVKDDLPYYFDGKVVPATHWFALNRVRNMTADEFRALLYSQGFTHVIINNQREFEDKAGAQHLQALFDALFSQSSLLNDVGGEKVYILPKA